MAAGAIRGSYTGGSFAEMSESIEPFLLAFAVSGLGLMLGLWLILLPAIHLIHQLVRPGKLVEAMQN